MKKLTIGIIAIIAIYFLFIRAKKVTPELSEIEKLKLSYTTNKASETDADFGKSDFKASQELNTGFKTDNIICSYTVY